MSTKALFLDRTSSNALVRALRDLLEAPTTEAMHAVLVREQALLVTEAAGSILESLFEEEMLEDPRENYYGPSYIRIHMSLLLACRSLGEPQGWQRWSSEFTGVASRDAVRAQNQTSMFNQNLFWNRRKPRDS